MGKLTLVELESFGVGCSFTWLSVHYEDAWDLWKLCKDDLVVVFNLSDYSIGEKVSVPFIIFRLM